MLKAFVKGMVEMMKAIGAMEEERLSSYDMNWERDYIEYLNLV